MIYKLIGKNAFDIHKEYITYKIKKILDNRLIDDNTITIVNYKKIAEISENIEFLYNNGLKNIFTWRINLNQEGFGKRIRRLLDLIEEKSPVTNFTYHVFEDMFEDYFLRLIDDHSRRFCPNCVKLYDPKPNCMCEDLLEILGECTIPMKNIRLLKET